MTTILDYDSGFSHFNIGQITDNMTTIFDYYSGFSARLVSSHQLPARSAGRGILEIKQQRIPSSCFLYLRVVRYHTAIPFKENGCDALC
jgi:hypothetical protein